MTAARAAVVGHDAFGGVGLAVGDALPVGAGLAVAVGLGEGDGLGDGDGLDGAGKPGEGGGVGTYSRCAVALALRSIVWLPPKNGARIGVTSVNSPLTSTVATEPSSSGQESGRHDMSISAGSTVTNEFRDSRATRQTTRLVAGSQGWPSWNDSGVRAAWNAPSRAAFVSVIWA